MEANITLNVDVLITGPQDPASCLAVYKTIVLKPKIVGTRNILTSLDMRFPDTKYVIKWKFDLDGKEIIVPENCLIEMAGGSLSNGKLTGNNTIIINESDNPEVFDVDMEGTWHYSDSDADGVTIVTNALGQLGVKNGSIGRDQLTGLSEVAFTGNYTDLSDKPFIPTIPEHILYILAESDFPVEVETGQTFFNTTLNKLVVYDGSSWINTDGTPVEASKSGTFAQAPTLFLSATNKGFAYFATDLGTDNIGAMIYYTGNLDTPWVYADGTAVKTIELL